MLVKQATWKQLNLKSKWLFQSNVYNLTDQVTILYLGVLVCSKSSFLVVSLKEICSTNLPEVVNVNYHYWEIERKQKWPESSFNPDSPNMNHMKYWNYFTACSNIPVTQYEGNNVHKIFWNLDDFHPFGLCCAESFLRVGTRRNLKSR